MQPQEAPGVRALHPADVRELPLRFPGTLRTNTCRAAAQSERRQALDDCQA